MSLITDSNMEKVRLEICEVECGDGDGDEDGGSAREPYASSHRITDLPEVDLFLK